MAVVAVMLPVVGLVGLGVLFGEHLAAISGLPIWAAPGMAIAIGVVCGLALAPTHLASLASGYLFGVAVGLPTAVIGVLIGAVIGYALALRLDSAVLRGMVERRRVGRVLAQSMLDRGPARAFFAVALARLPPQVPFALGNVLAASLRVRLGPMLSGTLVGMLPRIALVVWLGAELAAWDPSVAPPMSLYLSGAAAIVGLGGLALWTAVILRHRAAAQPALTTPGGEADAAIADTRR